MQTKCARLVMVLGLVVPLGVAVAAPAGAAAGTSCAKQAGTATLKPGLSKTAKPQTITLTTKITACKGGGVTSGAGKATLKQASANCLGLAKLGTKLTITETITWNTKQTSTFAGTVITGPKVAQAKLSGKISAGLFKGLSATTVIGFAPKGTFSCTTDANPLKTLGVTSVTALTIK